MIEESPKGTLQDGERTSIVDFINARLSDDERTANSAGGGSWRWQTGPAERDGIVDHEGVLRLWDGDDGAGGIDCLGDENVHIVRHDPDRVLREVASKRAIIGEHSDDEGQCARCLDSDGITYLGAYTAPWPCPTLRALAAVYSDHPDYRPDW